MFQRVFKKNAKANINLMELKFCKAKLVRKCFENLKIEMKFFEQCVNYIICSWDF